VNLSYGQRRFNSNGHGAGRTRRRAAAGDVGWLQMGMDARPDENGGSRSHESVIGLHTQAESSALISGCELARMAHQVSWDPMDRVTASMS
jgi:hypothetical protein